MEPMQQPPQQRLKQPPDILQSPMGYAEQPQYAQPASQLLGQPCWYVNKLATPSPWDIPGKSPPSGYFNGQSIGESTTIESATKHPTSKQLHGSDQSTPSPVPRRDHFYHSQCFMQPPSPSHLFAQPPPSLHPRYNRLKSSETSLQPMVQGTPPPLQLQSTLICPPPNLHAGAPVTRGLTCDSGPHSVLYPLSSGHALPNAAKGGCPLPLNFARLTSMPQLGSTGYPPPIVAYSPTHPQAAAHQSQGLPPPAAAYPPMISSFMPALSTPTVSAVPFTGGSADVRTVSQSQIHYVGVAPPTAVWDSQKLAEPTTFHQPVNNALAVNSFPPHFPTPSTPSPLSAIKNTTEEPEGGEETDIPDLRHQFLQSQMVMRPGQMVVLPPLGADRSIQTIQLLTPAMPGQFQVQTIVLPIVKLNAAGQPVSHQPLLPLMPSLPPPQMGPMMKEEPAEYPAETAVCPTGQLEEPVPPAHSVRAPLNDAYGVQPPLNGANAQCPADASVRTESSGRESTSVPSVTDADLRLKHKSSSGGEESVYAFRTNDDLGTMDSCCVKASQTDVDFAEEEYFQSESDILIKTDDDNTLLNQVDETGLPKVMQGIDLDRVKQFAHEFKTVRLSLGLTQAQVGLALQSTDGMAVSQSSICRFEKLEITALQVKKLLPSLQAWLREVKERQRSGLPVIIDLQENKEARKRKKRTVFAPDTVAILSAEYDRDSTPTTAKIAEIADKVGLEKETVRVWFCNRRQSERKLHNPVPGLVATLANIGGPA